MGFARPEDGECQLAALVPVVGRAEAHAPVVAAALAAELLEHRRLTAARIDEQERRLRLCQGSSELEFLDGDGMVAVLKQRADFAPGERFREDVGRHPDYASPSRIPAA